MEAELAKPRHGHDLGAEPNKFQEKAHSEDFDSKTFLDATKKGNVAAEKDLHRLGFGNMQIEGMDTKPKENRPTGSGSEHVSPFSKNSDTHPDQKGDHAMTAAERLREGILEKMDPQMRKEYEREHEESRKWQSTVDRILSAFKPGTVLGLMLPPRPATPIDDWVEKEVKERLGRTEKDTRGKELKW